MRNGIWLSLLIVITTNISTPANAGVKVPDEIYDTEKGPELLRQTLQSDKDQAALAYAMVDCLIKESDSWLNQKNSEQLSFTLLALNTKHDDVYRLLEDKYSDFLCKFLFICTREP